MAKRYQITVYAETAPTIAVQELRTNGNGRHAPKKPIPAKVQELKIKWDPVWGSRPSEELFQQIRRQELAQRGSKTEYALAMLLREDGTSLAQLKAALGATYLSRATYLEEKGRVTMFTKKINGHTHYSMNIIPKLEDEFKEDTDEADVPSLREMTEDVDPDAQDFMRTR